MSKKVFPIVELTLDKIVGGGQALGSLDYGKKHSYGAASLAKK